MHLAPHFSGFFLSRLLLKLLFMPSSSPEWIRTVLKMPVDVTSMLGRFLWLFSLLFSWKSKSVSIWNLTVLFSIKQVLSPPGPSALISCQGHLLQTSYEHEQSHLFCFGLGSLAQGNSFLSSQIVSFLWPSVPSCRPLLSLPEGGSCSLSTGRWGRACSWMHRPF